MSRLTVQLSPDTAWEAVPEAQAWYLSHNLHGYVDHNLAKFCGMHLFCSRADKPSTAPGIQPLTPCQKNCRSWRGLLAVAGQCSFQLGGSDLVHLHAVTSIPGARRCAVEHVLFKYWCCFIAGQ